MDIWERERELKELYEADTEEEDSSEPTTGGVRAIPGERVRVFVNDVEIGEDDDPWEEYDRQIAERNQRMVADMRAHYLRLLDEREENYAGRKAEKRKHEADQSHGTSNLSQLFKLTGLQGNSTVTWNHKSREVIFQL